MFSINDFVLSSFIYVQGYASVFASSIATLIGNAFSKQTALYFLDVILLETSADDFLGNVCRPNNHNNLEFIFTPDDPYYMNHHNNLLFTPDNSYYTDSNNYFDDHNML